jgi:hypothetical protein
VLAVAVVVIVMVVVVGVYGQTSFGRKQLNSMRAWKSAVQRSV